MVGIGVTVIDARWGSEYNGWEPLMTWLREHDIDPSRCRRIEYGEGVVRATMFARDADGHFFADGGDAAVESIVRRYVEPPPTRG